MCLSLWSYFEICGKKLKNGSLSSICFFKYVCIYIYIEFFMHFLFFYVRPLKLTMNGKSLVVQPLFERIPVEDARSKVYFIKCWLINITNINVLFQLIYYHVYICYLCVLVFCFVLVCFLFYFFANCFLIFIFCLFASYLFIF